MLREEDPQLSLHYWDWNTDPAGLLTNTFMGSSGGDACEPWLSNGFYDPNANPFRADDAFDPEESDTQQRLRRSSYRDTRLAIGRRYYRRRDISSDAAAARGHA